MFRFFGPVEDGSKEMMAIFASDHAIDILEKAHVISVDGTFDTAPAPFCQIFVVIAQLNCETKANIPVVFGLLPNKTTRTYVKFFEQLASFTEKMFTGIRTAYQSIILPVPYFFCLSRLICF